MDWLKMLRLSETDGAAAGGTTGGETAPNTGTTDGGGASASGQTAQPEFRVPAGYRLASDSDWTAREAALDRARKLGIDNDDGFKEYSSLAETLRARGMKPGQIAQMLAGGGPAKPAQKQPETQAFDPEKFKAELKAEQARERAMEDHTRREKDVDKYVGEMVKELLGGQDDEIMGPILRDALIYQLHQERFKAGVPEGHPLHGQVAGMYSDELFDGFKKSRGDLGTKLQGWQLKKIGEAASKAAGKAPVSTGSKASGSDGAKGDGRDTPIGKQTPEQRAAYEQSVRARLKIG